MVQRSRFLLFFSIFLATRIFADSGDSKLPALDPKAFDRAAAAHLLARAGFGGTPEEIEALAAMGLEAAVDRLLAPPGKEDALPPFEMSSPGRPSPRELAGLSKDERQMKVREAARLDAGDLQRLRAWWFRRMVMSPRPLEEKMTLFWHGHFATSQMKVKDVRHIFLQNQTLRANALGNFKELTRAIAKDPAMLAYLDNARSNRRAPNENFARELLELFTLGLGNYTEKDIKEAARAFTGWTFQGDQFVFNRRAHDPEDKTFLGRSGRLDGDDIIDTVFDQPAASRFIVRKLFVFLVHDDPPAGAVEALAAALRENRFEMRPVLRLLFTSAEFYAPRARGTGIKSPVELVVGTLRLLRLDPGASPAGAGLAGRMGQDLFRPPSVKGWDGGKSWISTSTLFDRYNFARPLIGLAGAGPRMEPPPMVEEPGGTPRPEKTRPEKAEKKAEKKAAGGPRGRGLAGAALPRWDARTGARDLLGDDPQKLEAQAVVDRVIRRFLLVPLGDDARAKIIEFYRSAPPRDRLAQVIHLVLSSPEYQLN